MSDIVKIKAKKINVKKNNSKLMYAKFYQQDFQILFGPHDFIILHGTFVECLPTIADVNMAAEVRKHDTSLMINRICKLKKLPRV